MNTRALGDHFIEPRKERNLSEVRHFQNFRNERNIIDVTDGNRRFKKYALPQNMKGIIQNQFGRRARPTSAHSCERDLPSLTTMFNNNAQFYRKLKV